MAPIFPILHAAFPFLFDSWLTSNNMRGLEERIESAIRRKQQFVDAQRTIDEMSVQQYGFKEEGEEFYWKQVTSKPIKSDYSALRFAYLSEEEAGPIIDILEKMILGKKLLKKASDAKSADYLYLFAGYRTKDDGHDTTDIETFCDEYDAAKPAAQDRFLEFCNALIQSIHPRYAGNGTGAERHFCTTEGELNLHLLGKILSVTKRDTPYTLSKECKETLNSYTSHRRTRTKHDAVRSLPDFSDVANALSIWYGPKDGPKAGSLIGSSLRLKQKNAQKIAMRWKELVQRYEDWKKQGKSKDSGRFIVSLYDIMIPDYFGYSSLSTPHRSLQTESILASEKSDEKSRYLVLQSAKPQGEVDEITGEPKNLDQRKIVVWDRRHRNLYEIKDTTLTGVIREKFGKNRHANYKRREIVEKLEEDPIFRHFYHELQGIMDKTFRIPLSITEPHYGYNRFGNAKSESQRESQRQVAEGILLRCLGYGGKQDITLSDISIVAGLKAVKRRGQKRKAKRQTPTTAPLSLEYKLKNVKHEETGRFIINPVDSNVMRFFAYMMDMYTKELNLQFAKPINEIISLDRPLKTGQQSHSAESSYESHLNDTAERVMQVHGFRQFYNQARLLSELYTRMPEWCMPESCGDSRLIQRLDDAIGFVDTLRKNAEFTMATAVKAPANISYEEAKEMALQYRDAFAGEFEYVKAQKESGGQNRVHLAADLATVLGTRITRYYASLIRVLSSRIARHGSSDPLRENYLNPICSAVDTFSGELQELLLEYGLGGVSLGTETSARPRLITDKLFKEADSALESYFHAKSFCDHLFQGKD